MRFAWALSGILSVACGSSDISSVNAPARFGPSHLAFPPTDEDGTTTMNPAPCAIDRINGQTAAREVVNLDRRGAVRLVGWASTSEMKRPNSLTVLMVEQETRVYVSAGSGVTGGHRPDVARALKAPGLNYAGFNIVFDLAKVPPGRYKIQLMYPGARGEPESCVPFAGVYIN